MLSLGHLYGRDVSAGRRSVRGIQVSVLEVELRGDVARFEEGQNLHERRVARRSGVDGAMLEA